MPFKGILTEGAPLRIRFQNSLKSAGTAVVVVGFSGPGAGADVLHQVAPGVTDDLPPGSVPAAVDQLLIDVSLPDAGTGVLSVESGEDWKDTLTADGAWLFMVRKPPAAAGGTS